MKRKRGGFKVYTDAEGDTRWRVVAGNGRIQADSGEGYRRRANAEAGAIATAIAILRALDPGALR
jgi:uncharacterized protein YegP (UPF0339 family)